MRPTAFVLLALASIAACRRPVSTPQPPPDRPIPRGPAVITPRTEAVSYGPYGVDGAACAAYLYAWDAALHACRLQLNHCRHGSRIGEFICVTRADERTVACGASFDACGQPVTCACPTGAAESVPDPPDVQVIHSDPIGARWGEAGRCEAASSEIPGARGADLSPLCVVAIHQCDPGAPCIDRTEMLSCGLRGTICGRPVRCECP